MPASHFPQCFRTDSPTPPENRRVTRQTPTGLRPPVVPKQKKQGRAMQRLNALMRSVGKKILQDSDHRAKQGHRHDEDSDDVILEDYDEEIMLKVQYKHHITRLNVRKVSLTENRQIWLRTSLAFY